MAGAVQFQPTPNPNAGKFVAGRPVVEGKASRSFYSAAQAAGDPLAEPLFRIEGVVSLFMVEDFITVTKRPESEWPELAPRIIAVLQHALA